LVIILILNSAPIDCSASIAADADQPTTLELAEIFNHVFIVNVTSKIETTDRTFYVFNVTEYIKTPVNSSTLYFTAYGGSKIMVSPATTFYLGLDYLFFCDEINEEYSITGLHYNYKLLDSVNPTEIEDIRKTLMALQAATIEHTIASPEIAIEDRELEQPVEPLVNPGTKNDLDPETVKENRAQDNRLLTIVYLCIAGIYITLIPVMKNGLKR
jgi:hypothetical protein